MTVPILTVMGSSPLSRGARDPIRLAQGRPGIIPAFAGSTRSGLRWRTLPRDHPRFRGEHSSTQPPSSVVRGSSPLSRGARGSPHDHIARRRIIPAFAGSTTRSPATRYASPDHPRFRGEHSGSRPATWATSGSSPLSRGALDDAVHDRPSVRIIPAFAGSTGCRRRADCGRADHPRFRGEHPTRRSVDGGWSGSSPLSRGAHQSCRVPSCCLGIIPAFAGSTVLAE